MDSLKEVRISGFFAIHCHLAKYHVITIMRNEHSGPQIPAALERGDTILLAAPARFVSGDQVQAAVNFIEAAGFNPMVPDGILLRDGQFGGSDAHRAKILNEGFAAKEVKAIWAMRGGYGCARLLPHLEGDCFSARPTWIMGFSDVTALHGWANQRGVASLHAPVANTFLLGTPAEQEGIWKAMSATRDVGEDSRVVGGNLSVLFSLLGTPYFPNCSGNWLLIEDLDEYLYHIDRMMLALRLAGVLDAVAGVLVGSFSDLRDNTQAHGQSTDNPFGSSVEDIIRSHVPANKAIHWNLPVGHGARNVSLVLGASWAQQKHHFALENP